MYRLQHSSDFLAIGTFRLLLLLLSQFIRSFDFFSFYFFLLKCWVSVCYTTITHLKLASSKPDRNFNRIYTHKLTSTKLNSQSHLYVTSAFVIRRALFICRSLASICEVAIEENTLGYPLTGLTFKRESRTR